MFRFDLFNLREIKYLENEKQRIKKQYKQIHSEVRKLKALEKEHLECKKPEETENKEKTISVTSSVETQSEEETSSEEQLKLQSKKSLALQYLHKEIQLEPRYRQHQSGAA